MALVCAVDPDAVSVPLEQVMPPAAFVVPEPLLDGLLPPPDELLSLPQAPRNRVPAAARAAAPTRRFRLHSSLPPDRTRPPVVQRPTFGRFVTRGNVLGAS